MSEQKFHLTASEMTSATVRIQHVINHDFFILYQNKDVIPVCVQSIEESTINYSNETIKKIA